jgi:tetratricopeptide (TPR) repeat protein
MQRELLGATHPDVAQTLNNLAFVQYDRGDTAGALATKREALAVYRRVFPKDHPDVARVMNQIGFWLTQAGQYAEADRDLQEALAMRRRLFGNSHPDVATSLVHVAILQVARREYDEGLVSARDAVAILSAAVSPTHWKTAVGESVEGAALTGLGRYAEAQPLLTRSLGILSKDGGAPPAYHDLAQRYLDRLHAQAGRAGSARQSYAVATTAPTS